MGLSIRSIPRISLAKSGLHCEHSAPLYNPKLSDEEKNKKGEYQRNRCKNMCEEGKKKEYAKYRHIRNNYIRKNRVII